MTEHEDWYWTVVRISQRAKAAWYLGWSMILLSVLVPVSVCSYYHWNAGDHNATWLLAFLSVLSCIPFARYFDSIDILKRLWNLRPRKPGYLADQWRYLVD